MTKAIIERPLRTSHSMILLINLQAAQKHHKDHCVEPCAVSMTWLWEAAIVISRGVFVHEEEEARRILEEMKHVR
jgi:hypothetical protein